MNHKPTWKEWTATVSSLNFLVERNRPEITQVSSVLFIGAMILCSSIVDNNFDES